MKDMKLPEYLNAAYEGDDLFTGDQLRAAVLAEREECVRRAEIAMLGADRELTLRLIAAIRAKGQS